MHSRVNQASATLIDHVSASMCSTLPFRTILLNVCNLRMKGKANSLHKFEFKRVLNPCAVVDFLRSSIDQPLRQSLKQPLSPMPSPSLTPLICIATAGRLLTHNTAYGYKSWPTLSSFDWCWLTPRYNFGLALAAVAATSCRLIGTVCWPL